jgi:hypothetical protein
MNKYKRDPLCDDLFTICDTALYDLVKHSAARFCTTLTDSGDVVEDLVQRSKTQSVKTTAYYLAHALRAMYNACQSQAEVTPDAVVIRTRTFIGLFARFCDENAYWSESAVAATEAWE